MMNYGSPPPQSEKEKEGEEVGRGFILRCVRVEQEERQVNRQTSPEETDGPDERCL